MKTLVTIGYHGMEREWGKLVRDAFEKKYSTEGLMFHVLECNNDEDFTTGTPNSAADNEICDIIEKDCRIGLLIDLHCGIIPDEKLEKYLKKRKRKDMEYRGFDWEIMKKIKQAYPDSDVRFWTRDSKTGIVGGRGIMVAVAIPDFFMSESSYNKRDISFHDGLEWQVGAVKYLHDLHR